MGCDLVCLDAFRFVFCKSIRAAESVFAQPGAILADPFMANGVGICLVRLVSIDIVVDKPVSAG